MTERAITRDGYAKIATLMAQVPETAVFRRFGELNARNLLYMQAELVALENKLQRYSREDCMSREAHRQDYGLDWQTLQDSVKDDASEGHDSSQWSTMLQIRAALEKYSIVHVFHKEPYPIFMRNFCAVVGIQDLISAQTQHCFSKARL